MLKPKPVWPRRNKTRRSLEKQDFHRKNFVYFLLVQWKIILFFDW